MPSRSSVVPFRRRRSPSEWLGARYEYPVEIREGRTVIKPEVVMWLELPEHLLLGTSISDPLAEAPFEETLLAVISQPAVGPPRRPSRIRVPNHELAEAARRVVGSDVEVIVAPVPELKTPSWTRRLITPCEPDHDNVRVRSSSPFFRSATEVFTDEREIN